MEFRRSISLFAIALLMAVRPGATAVIPVGGACALSDAFTAANTDAATGGCPAGSGADTITMSGDVTLTVPAEYYAYSNSGLPAVRSAITLEGNGFVVERDPAAPDFRIFSVASNGSLSLFDATVRNGRTTDMGGGLYVSGGTVLVRDSTFTANYTPYVGAALYGTANATVMLERTVVRANVGLGGSGVEFVGVAYASIQDSTIADNASGGVALLTSGPVVIETTTISGNQGDGVNSFENRATLLNTTISGNTGIGVRRGFYGMVDLVQSTVFGNGIGGVSEFGGGYGTVLNSSIVAGNAGPDCDGPIIDLGNNFAEDPSCGAGFTPIDVGPDIDPALAANGGPTRTHALPEGSVAIDAAGDCGVATDQRGRPRSDGACDSGAYEFEEPLLVTMASMSAVADGDGVLVRWTTALEIDTFGFRVLREVRGNRERAREPIGAFVFAVGNGAGGTSYELRDDSPQARRARHYFVEELDIFGRTALHGPIAVERAVRVDGGRRTVPRRSRD